jgi:hypothetical protein
MPFELAGMSFDFLSGPNGLCMLLPTEQLIQHLKNGFDALPICGFKDIHQSIQKNCYDLNMCKDGDSNCFTLYTRIFYRLR